MSNSFFRITSNGGYIGRWSWVNTGAPGANEVCHVVGWGCWFVLQDRAIDLKGSAWIGSIPIFRYLTR